MKQTILFRMKKYFVNFIKDFLPQGKYASFTLLLFIIFLELLTNCILVGNNESLKGRSILYISYVLYVSYVIYNLHVNMANQKAKRNMFIFLYVLLLLFVTCRLWFSNMQLSFINYSEFTLFVWGCIGSVVYVIKSMITKIQQQNMDVNIYNEAMFCFGLCLVIMLIN